MKRVPLPVAWRDRALVIGDVMFWGHWFSPHEAAISEAFRLQKRRTEWKHGRIAAKQLALDLRLGASPRDCVVEGRRLIIGGAESPHYVSISHSGGYAGAAIDAGPVGIDVERLREINEAAVHLFLAGEEAEEMRGCRLAHRMLHFWAAKEAAWKQRGGETETLKRVPLKLEAETPAGLRFREVETFATGELVMALTRPTS